MGASQPQTIPWAEVSDVQRGKYAPTQPSTQRTALEARGGRGVPGTDVDVRHRKQGAAKRVESRKPRYWMADL